MKSVVQLALRGYKRWISPVLPPSCKYTPTCSEYAMEALERLGILRGGVMSVWRLLRCNPFSKGGYDPVREHRYTQKICHPDAERSEAVGSLHSSAVAKCIDPSLRSG
jgi:putative membrane protein insertion efficiency factor